MDWIDENVAIGNWRDALRIRLLKKERIDAMINAKVLFDQRFFSIGRVPLKEDVLRIAGMMNDLASSNYRILIFCHHGRDRSPFVAMLYLSRRTGSDLETSYRSVKEKRPITILHWDWMRSVQD